MVPGRYGRLEWRGVEAGEGPARGTRRIYVYTPRPRMIPRLLAVAGVHRWQMGDDEAALWLAADDVQHSRPLPGPCGPVSVEPRRPAARPWRSPRYALDQIHESPQDSRPLCPDPPPCASPPKNGRVPHAI